ncbi:uncharacterized protein LOC120067679 [Benincasa hispida]|uniref:uncharacterized protein LOC120067679 n=1 Tax=Benincasa hispida TaxID=102211 RepID=UPI001901E8B6|nr:uncharacterized protein LOC120067679 [Benincasa hispida]
MLMENFLRSKEYWTIVEAGVNEPATGVVLSEVDQKKLEERKLKDLKAKNYLFQAIDRTILETISQKDTCKQIWDSMKKKYQDTTRVKRQQLQALRKEFEILKMKQSESVDGERINRGRGRGRGRWQGRRRGGGHDPYKKTSNNNSRLDKSNIQYYRCHKFVHYKSECTTNFNHEKREQSNFIEEKEQETLLMTCHHNKELGTNIWYIDTVCSNHMCGNKPLFSHLDESYHSTVTFGNNSKVNVVGKRNIQIKIKKGNVEPISNVFYIPNLRSNLLSVGQLQEKGYVTTIK